MPETPVACTYRMPVFHHGACSPLQRAIRTRFCETAMSCDPVVDWRTHFCASFRRNRYALRERTSCRAGKSVAGRWRTRFCEGFAYHRTRFCVISSCLAKMDRTHFCGSAGTAYLDRGVPVSAQVFAEIGTPVQRCHSASSWRIRVFTRRNRYGQIDDQRDTLSTSKLPPGMTTGVSAMKVLGHRSRTSPIRLRWP